MWLALNAMNLEGGPGRERIRPVVKEGHLAAVKGGVVALAPGVMPLRKHVMPLRLSRRFSGCAWAVTL